LNVTYPPIFEGFDASDVLIFTLKCIVCQI
jgi:hypothetical protein